jgi:shikimate kinase
MKDQIWLIGFMATGKSRVARPLAAALDWRVIDIDRLVEERAGRPVREIFAADGEEAFRALESAAIEQAAGERAVVVATGGGAVLAPQNREAMRRRGYVVALDARAETIVERLRASGGISERPLLAGGDPLGRIVALKEQRQPLYAQADFIIQTDGLTPDQVTHQVLNAYREHVAVGAGGAA